MSNGLTLINYIWSKLLSLFFNDLTVTNGATVGWIIFAVIMFSFIFLNLLSVPRALAPNLYRGQSYSKIEARRSRERGSRNHERGRFDQYGR